MAGLRVNPNRMELLKLRRRRDVARRGHKLLKDKLDELMKEFLARIASGRQLRREVEEGLRGAYGLFAIARAEAGSAEVTQALLAGEPAEVLHAGEMSVMSVRVPVFGEPALSEPAGYSFATTPAVLDQALARLTAVAPLMIELAAREKAIELLAAEIERTRRRVNALEYVLLPQLESAVREIRMKLDEAERSDLARLMKVKEMLEAEGRG
ncbi:MAG: V-type ATP synthase subunit D [Actinobacteria bacterium]|nr:MAG: V-type ATP synthase subunit D [Actinomycetota bacterium]